ncbi:MAG: MarR family winged helix-turn-helix transcriptional regulator [Terasakiella sp.]|uniref:MarR family winged helix-turn-helix transcriptional regulator n=1 Tax=unclassified Terasakiella TaxID=2614952 RepID=UPI003B00C465
MIDEDKNTIPIILHEVANRLRVRIDAKVQPYNLTRMKWLTLAILERDNGMSQSELASKLDVDNSSIARLMTRMEQRDLIHRVCDENDRRVLRVFIKDEARPLLQELKKVSDEIRSQALTGLSVKEQDDLLNLLLVVKNNLDK